MHPGFGIAIVALVFLLAGLSWIRSQYAFQWPWQKVIFALATLLAVVVLIAYVPMAWIIGPVGLIGGWIVRSLLRLGIARAATGHFRGSQPSAGNSSSVSTEWLEATLDHDSGRMNAEVLLGVYRGRLLDSLSLEQLRELISELSDADAGDSLQLLETFLDQAFPDWRVGTRHQSAPDEEASAATSQSMSRSEALEILGLGSEVTREDVINAHRRLISRLHPDKGGSSYLAAKLNQAKDYLLDGWA